MPATNGSHDGPRDWRRRESLPSALVQVAVVGVLLASAVTYVVHRGSVRQQMGARMKAARTLAQRDNPADLRKALAELEALFRLDADARDAQALAADVNARLWLEYRQPDAEAPAREHLARAEALDSRSGERYGTRALILLAEGKATEAEQFLEGLKAQGAKSPKLSLAEAQALLARGRLSEARQAFARASEAAWREPRYPVAHGEALLDEGLYAQAAEALKKATAANPDHLRARLSLALARLYQGTGRDEATKIVTDVLAREAELSPALKARARVVRAAVALADGNTDEALKDAGEALAASPEEHHALFIRARALALKKDPGARAAFQEAVAKRRTAPLLYLDGARALQEAGDGEGALALLDAYEAVFRGVQVPAPEGKTVGALERDERYWLARGHVLEALARADDAMAAYDRALAVKGVGMARAQYAKAALLLARKDYDTARPLLVEVAPESGMGTLPEAYEAMGELLFAKGEFAHGCQHYFFGLTRARLQGAPLEALKVKASDVEKHLAAAGQPTMAKAWKTETDALLQ
ncbi:tetratricopeptide repeat protein [Vitiosangium sp. GDMCC 1.1324]|uniref:tetratricopeptide repeat protein n=1 Tax=Vitiosangium sp. (strain GDMCC 1.1324) TaxID=2138576 RepID=UPI000D39F40D|nr:tetratricopeptide repeat protein [Vitiosangium sp. GDMCC 1.1324]PTL80412.1 cellulose synthase [Vitiosangium sp. GDMCC 1.1324]